MEAWGLDKLGGGEEGCVSGYIRENGLDGWVLGGGQRGERGR